MMAATGVGSHTGPDWSQPPASADGTPIQHPTAPGSVRGIIARDPITLQCRDCGAIMCPLPRHNVNLAIIVCGWHFHPHEGRETTPRRCAGCLAKVRSECDQCRNDGR